MEQKEPQKCWRCGGSLLPQSAIDMHSGIRVELLVCRSCSRRWYGGDTPRLAIAAWR